MRYLSCNAKYIYSTGTDIELYTCSKLITTFVPIYVLTLSTLQLTPLTALDWTKAVGRGERVKTLISPQNDHRGDLYKTILPVDHKNIHCIYVCILNFLFTHFHSVKKLIFEYSQFICMFIEVFWPQPKILRLTTNDEWRTTTTTDEVGSVKLTWDKLQAIWRDLQKWFIPLFFFKDNKQELYLFSLHKTVIDWNY